MKETIFIVVEVEEKKDDGVLRKRITPIAIQKENKIYTEEDLQEILAKIVKELTSILRARLIKGD